jgi:hypothetical protein
MKRRASLLLAAALLLAPSLVTPAGAQAPAPTSEDRMVLSPARFELEIPPGEERTVILHLRFSSSAATPTPARLKAYVGDWGLSSSGEVEFFPAGSRPRSACPWIIYSPSELTITPPSTHMIRMTVTVPPDAEPGDHLAVLFVEPRTADLKTATRGNVFQFSVRVAALIYVMVPTLTRELALTNLTATGDARGLVVVPTLSNGGNTHVRPLHTIEVLDAAGVVVAQTAAADRGSVLGHSSASPSFRLDAALAPGTYSVRYRADARDGGRILEGLTELSVPSLAAR